MKIQPKKTVNQKSIREVVILKADYTEEKWKKQYAESRGVYKSFSKKMESLLVDLIEGKDIDIVKSEHRAKSVESFIKKFNREDKDYSDPINEMTDLAGVRVVTYYVEDVDRIGEIINSEFDVDKDNSIDKYKILKEDQFGYLSVQWIISLGKNRKQLEEWKPYAGLKVEVQVRTALQHAWASVDHKLRYKPNYEPPRKLKRKLYRLSALFELADEEFSAISQLSEKEKSKYKSVFEKGIYEVEFNSMSLDVYLEATGKRMHC